MAIGKVLGCAGFQHSAVPTLREPVRLRAQCRRRGKTVSMSVQKTSKTVQQAEKMSQEFRQSSSTPLPLLHQVADALVQEMYAGLASEGGSDQLKMLPTYVENLPSGSEKGLFYAVDLGGTNFRVLRVELGGKTGQILSQEFKEVVIPPELMVGTGKDLFDFIAGTLASFVDTEDESIKAHFVQSGKTRESGFAFSFPVRQTSVKSGIVIHWTKGFKVDDAVGKDIVKQFQDAISRSNHQIMISALVNDTVGTLAGGRFNFDEETMIGCIIGTGTNACYVERADAVHKWDEPLPKSGEMVINMEWGNFRSPYLPRTFADETVDKDSVNPGDQWFEKMISGMYLGEIVRLVLARMAKEAELFGGNVPVKLLERLTLGTPHVSKIHLDNSPDLDVVAKVLKDVFEIETTTLEERKIVHEVCDIMGERGGRLAAAGLYGILKKIGRTGKSRNGSKKKTVIAMDGGLFEHHVRYRSYMEEALQELMGSDAAYEVALRLQNDGSGIGAALLAASHSHFK
uniref:Phosphotransferase n=1 Tax=Physcomitrium patens TaxID=3218 RepID=Q6X271_PHYPA|nr:hexokinase PpHxk1 [Physcomitrium patens]AAQ72424.1 hexokinase PpHxk1 [Physcomitrium patens]